MTDTATMNPEQPRAGESAAAPAAGVTASDSTASPVQAIPAGPIDIARLERRLYDYVMGHVELTGMQAEAAISLLKQARSAPPPVVKRRKPRRKAS